MGLHRGQVQVTERTLEMSYHRLALAAVLLLNLSMSTVDLTRLGNGNLYYAAAVKSMLTGWSSFFFFRWIPVGSSALTNRPLPSGSKPRARRSLASTASAY